MSEIHNPQELRAELFDQIRMIENPSMLGERKAYLKQLLNRGDFWENLTDSQKAHIEKGMADNDAGRNKPFEVVMRNKYA